MPATPDTSIILQAGQIPFNDAAGVQQVQQIQANNLALTQQRQQAQGQNALAKLYQNPQNVQNGQLTKNALAQVMAIDPTTGIALQNQQLSLQGDQLKVKQQQVSYLADNVSTPAMEAYQTALKTMPAPAAAAVGQQIYADGIKTAASSGVFSQDQISQMPPNFDPNRISAGLQNYNDYQKNQLAQSKLSLDAAKDSATINLDQQKIGIEGARLGQDAPGTKGWTVMTDPATGNQIRYNADTGQSTTLDGSQKVALGGNIQKPGANGAVSPDDPNMNATAAAIAAGQLPPLTGYALKSAAGQQLMAKVLQINPSYSAPDYNASVTSDKAFDTGQQGKTVESFNVGISHLTTLQSLADALNNGDIKTFNKIGNQVASETGRAAPTNFEAAKAIVGDEIIKAIVGGGGALADRENAQNQIDAANSPEQLSGVIKTYKNLMAGQLKGLQTQYTTSTGQDSSKFLDKLSPETQAQLGMDGGTAPASPKILQYDADGNLVQ